jgi:hypothetical protein
MTGPSEEYNDSDPVKPDYVYSLHGIRTNAPWQSQLSAEITARTGFDVGYRNYKRFDLLMFVLKNTFYHKPLRLVENDLRELQKKYRVNIIAHSFGSWLILKALSDNSDIKIHNVIFCGAVFPRAQSIWRQLKNDRCQITGDIVNFCGMRDPFPALAEFLSRDYGASGTVGAGDPVIEDSFHDVGHSGLLTRDFCRKHLSRVLQGGYRKRHPVMGKLHWYINTLLWLAAHRGAIGLAALMLAASAYHFYRSEWSCYIRRCHIDVVRIHNYTSSTRAEGPRGYVNRITFEYALNFDATAVTFRAPKDRKPIVTSFIGDQLTELRAQEIDWPVVTADGIQNRSWFGFTVPVRERRAYFSAEFSNNVLEGPGGIAVVMDRVVRNLRLQIVLPDDVKLAPPSSEFRKGLLLDGQQLSNEKLASCKVDGNGEALNCANLNFLPQQEFYYCFMTVGWNQPGEFSPKPNDLPKKCTSQTRN